MIRNFENNNTLSTYGELFLNNLETYETLSFNEPFYATDYLFYQWN